MPTYQIVEAPADSAVGYRPYGAAADLWLCKRPEVIIAGPAETGKTRIALEKLDALLWKYPRAQAVMVRKRYTDMPGSCIQTYEQKVLGAWDSSLNDGAGGFDQAQTPVTKYGGEKPQFYDYPHGARLWVAGLDKPGKVLSSERDFIYVNQAEELELSDWETLTTRATGRAGHAPYAQVFGDCNPGPANHWILERAAAGQLLMIHSRHEDNPTLFDQESGEITPQGERTMAVLDGLTGVRKSRLRFGHWVSAEGLVYEEEWNPDLHLIPPFEIPKSWQRVRLVDFGYVNPFVCLWAALDEDKRMYIYRQLYMTRRTVRAHAEKIKELSRGEVITTTVCDHDAEDRATLEENGIRTITAFKAISPGIQAVKERLKLQGDGRPRFFILMGSLVEKDPELVAAHLPTCLEDEFPVYIWADNKKKDIPVDENNHAMDSLRYGVAWADNTGQKKAGTFGRRK